MVPILLGASASRVTILPSIRADTSCRALAAMLYRVGLLPRHNEEQVPFAYKIFKDGPKEINHFIRDREDPKGWLSKNFRAIFSREVTVEFIGLW